MPCATTARLRNGTARGARLLLYSRTSSGCTVHTALGALRPQFSIGYFSLTASQAPPFLKFGPSPEIDFFDVSDDFEQKNKYYFWYKNIFGLGKINKKKIGIFFGFIIDTSLALYHPQVLLTRRPNPAEEFLDVSNPAG